MQFPSVPPSLFDRQEKMPELFFGTVLVIGSSVRLFHLFFGNYRGEKKSISLLEKDFFR